MAIKEGDIIKHDRFLDMAIFVTEVTKRLPIGTAVHGEWINLGYVSSQFINLSTRQTNKNTIMVRKDEPWLRLTDPDKHKCYRHGNWEKL